MIRWLDVLVLIALDVLAVALWAGKGLWGMGAPVALLWSLTLAWGLARLWASADAVSDDWRGAWRGFPAGWRLYLTLLAWGGRRPVQWALVPLVMGYWVFLRGPQRDGIAEYLRRRMPDASGPARAWAHLRLLLEFAFSLVDRFHLLLHGAGGLTIDRSAIPGLQAEIYGERYAGQGLLVLSAHLGNADFASTALNATQREVTLVLHRTPTDPYFALLERSGGEGAAPPKVLAVNASEQFASLEIIRRLRAGEVVAMKADRVVDGRFATVDFLGGTIQLPTGPWLVAALSGAPVLVLGCFRTGDLTYRMEAVGPRTYAFANRATREADLQRWAQELADVFERWTEQYPLQWFNFFDPWSPTVPAEEPSENPRGVP
ncbi:MAG: hypothetical protein R3F61_01590 [Myxococcota bacterium]